MKKMWLILIIVIVSINCASNKKIIKTNNKNIFIENKLLRTIPPIKPNWVFNIPEDKKDYFIYVGQSNLFVIEKDARKNALQDCIKQFAEYCGVEVKYYSKTATASFGLSSDIKNPTVAELTSNGQKVEANVSRMKPKNYYIEEWQKGNQKFYKVYVKATIPKNEYAKVQKWKENQKKQQQKIEELKAIAKPISMQFAFMSYNRYGNSKVLKNGSDVYSNKEFKLFVKPNQDCYLYVFNIDTTKNIACIFPNKNLDNVNPLQKGIEYLIPKNKVFAFDENKGAEIFYIFVFRKPQINLENIIKTNLSVNDFKVKLKKMYSTRGVNINNSNNQININKFGNAFPEVITGADYIMRKMKFIHY